MRRRYGVTDEQAIAVVEPKEPMIADLLSVVLSPQADDEGGDNDAINPRTMLTARQTVDFQEKFTGLLTAFCDTREINIGAVEQNLLIARHANDALRTVFGGNGHASAPRAEPQEAEPASTRPARKKRAAKAPVVKPPRDSNNAPASHSDGPKPGSDKAIALDVITEAGEQGITAVEIKAKQPGLGRMNNILRALLNDGYIRNITGGGRGNMGVYVAVSQNAAKVKSSSGKCDKRSDGPRSGSQLAIALDAITAGRDGITAAQFREGNPGVKNPNNVFRVLIKRKLIRNAAGKGRGNKANYVAVSQDGENTGTEGASASTEKGKGGRWWSGNASRSRQKRKDADEGDTEADSSCAGDSKSDGGESHKRPERVQPLTFWKEPRERKSRPSKPPPKEYAVPRLRRLLPTRPLPLPPTALVTKKPTSPAEWDGLIMRILMDWNWQLKFPQLLIALKEEGPSYGYSIGDWSSTRIENEARYSVMRLEKANRLRIGDDKVTLFPVKTLSQIEAERPVEVAQDTKPVSLSQSSDPRSEIEDDEDWYLAVMQIIQDAEGSITKPDIVDELQKDELADWRLPADISRNALYTKVTLVISQLLTDGVIVVDEEVEAVNDEDIAYRNA